MSSLQNAETLILPTQVGFDLDLRKLQTVEKLVLPKYANRIKLDSLKNFKQIILPESFNSLECLPEMKYLILTEGMLLEEELEEKTQPKFNSSIKILRKLFCK